LRDGRQSLPSRLREGAWEGLSSPEMLEMRPDCERCGSELPADQGGAFICSFECTFCADCADDLDETCPNCGGELLDRPARVGDALKKYPASTARRFSGNDN